MGDEAALALRGRHLRGFSGLVLRWAIGGYMPDANSRRRRPTRAYRPRPRWWRTPYGRSGCWCATRPRQDPNPGQDGPAAVGPLAQDGGPRPGHGVDPG